MGPLRSKMYGVVGSADIILKQHDADFNKWDGAAAMEGEMSKLILLPIP